MARLLIVEDSDSDREIMRRLVARLYPNATIETAATLAAAKDRLSYGGVDAVVLDLTLPDSERSETVAAIAQSTTAVIVAVSGVMEREDRERSRRQGALVALSKDELRRRVMDGDTTLLDELRPKFQALKERCRGRSDSSE